MYIYSVLQNPLYLGLTKHYDKTYPGEHEAIIDKKTWDKAQELLATNLTHSGKKDIRFSPSESDIITHEVIKKIEARFSTDGVKAKFIKVHSLTGADGDLYLEAIIKRNGKRYFATFLIIKIIDGKPVLMDSGLEETEDGNLGFLNEIGQ